MVNIMKSRKLFNKVKKAAAFVCVLSLGLSSFTSMAAGGGKDAPPPADVQSGAVVSSLIYGEVAITKRPDGVTEYTFHDEGRPAVQQILRSMARGENLDYTAIILSTASSPDNVNNITTYRGDYIKNDLKYNTGSTVEYPGNYSTGRYYGSGLSSKNLGELQSYVSKALLDYNVGGKSEIEKIKIAHDHLIRTCVPAPNKDDKHNWGNAWGSIVYHEANSRGYARGMKALLDAMGIGCYVVDASSDSALKNYSWVVVRCGEYWYIVDAYADDATGTNGCFMIGDATYRAMGMRWNDRTAPEARYNYY